MYESEYVKAVKELKKAILEEFGKSRLWKFMIWLLTKLKIQKGRDLNE